MHTMSFVFCSLPAFLVCEYVLQYWSCCSRCPLQQRFPTQRSWLWRVDNCRKCIAHLFVTLGSLGSWGAFLLRCSVCWKCMFFLFAWGVEFFCQTVPAARTCVAPNGRNPREGSLMPGRQQRTFIALSSLPALWGIPAGRLSICLVVCWYSAGAISRFHWLIFWIQESFLSFLFLSFLFFLAGPAERLGH